MVYKGALRKYVDGDSWQTQIAKPFITLFLFSSMHGVEFLVNESLLLSFKSI